MVSSRKSARSHALKGKTPSITHSFSSPCTWSVTQKLFASPPASSTFSADCPNEVFKRLLDLSKQLEQLEHHRLSKLEQCIHRIPNHLLTPLIHISSSDDDSDFRPATVPPPSHTPYSPILERTPLPTPTPENDLDEDPEEDPAEDSEEDLYWII
ncbi:hypothetical protein D8674_025708 [Pyrus ussuriensis x Pyrus communis]|uniref:Uncharacterized protein n=1 Tax=Pyrus ussuriensis x Pyrus communis TaxID=2448454 RepID=A0A5N5IIW4_9ROSA|nr:hypothetical protein D8674_025708 [Pyrus ussuriensis x Pyrus communis]